MSLLFNLSVVVFTAILHSTFQLNVGCLLLLFKRKLTSRKTENTSLVGSFISAVGLFTIVFLMASCFLVTNLFGTKIPTYIVLIEIGILFALSVATLFVYYKKGKGTELWLPRPIASFISDRATETNNSTEAFGLGFTSLIGELPFTAILIFIASTSITNIPQEWQLLAIVLYSIIVIIPLLAIGSRVNSGSKTLSDIQKWREKNKPFFRFVMFLGFLIFSIYLFVFQIMPLLAES